MIYVISFPAGRENYVNAFRRVLFMLIFMPVWVIGRGTVESYAPFGLHENVMILLFLTKVVVRRSREMSDASPNKDVMK